MVALSTKVPEVDTAAGAEQACHLSTRQKRAEYMKCPMHLRYTPRRRLLFMRCPTAHFANCFSNICAIETEVCPLGLAIDMPGLDTVSGFSK
jgi:hypothetical protein